MIFFLVGFALILHVAFWGAGLALLVMPRRWHRFWPAIVMPAGFMLQSLVVWVGAYANLAGTNRYAAPAELLPAGLLAVALWRRGWRPALGDVRAFRVVGAVLAGTLALLILPLAITLKGLTTVSLSSCDAADYAAGARTLMEFAHSDRSGFLGLTEVVRTQSADNFFDFWLRLNHFTPSALIAFNGSILHCAPHELTSLLAMVVLAGSVPVVFWLARAGLGLDGRASLLVAVFYGFSPVTWYAVAQVSPSQLLAAQAIALLTWAGVALWRTRLTVRRGAQFAGVLALGYGLILGSYNFILLVCLVPAVAYAGGLALRHGAWRKFAGWICAVMAPLVGVGLIFAPRVAGLAERFALFRTFDFGWRIPLLSPEGWLGILDRAPLLGGLAPGLRWGASLVLVAAIVVVAWRHRALGWRIAAFTLPALAGYAYLEWRGATLGTNASYDAYKLLAVFFPGILASAAAWLLWLPQRGGRRILALVAVTLVSIAHAQSVSQFFRALKAPPLRVTLELRDLRKIEALPDVKSLNLLLPDMWSRLWANEFLLRKAQYFATDTYEARWHIADPKHPAQALLRGDWDLETGRIARRPPNEDRRPITPQYALVDTRSAAYFRASLGDGWHAEESIPETAERWQWTERDATVHIENPHDYPLTITCTLDARSLDERDISIGAVGGAASGAPVHFSPTRARLTSSSFAIPPGKSVLVLHSAAPGIQVPGDPRSLALCVFQIEIASRVEP
jgi:hypothetical protein